MPFLRLMYIMAKKINSFLVNLFCVCKQNFARSKIITSVSFQFSKCICMSYGVSYVHLSENACVV